MDKDFCEGKASTLYGIIDDCVEFRDILMITGGSLATLAKEYTNTQKLVGDLDYNVPRNYKTPLHSEKITDKDLQYCYNDVGNRRGIYGIPFSKPISYRISLYRLQKPGYCVEK